MTADARLVTPTLAACLGITAGAHVAVYLLNATLPLHLVALGGSKTEVGLLFSTSGVVSMLLRPLVGGWIDRHGFRPVMLPGALVLVATLLVLPLAATPLAFIVLMGGIGFGNGLISTGAGVLAAQASPPARRGEALGVYYVTTSISFSVGPPLGFALYASGGMRRCFLGAAVIGVGIGLLILSLRVTAPAAASRFRWLSRRALPAAATVIAVNVGYSSIYAFLPLYAIASGLDGNLGWFYAVFSACIIVGRLTLNRLSDRIGRARVIVPAIAATVLSYGVLALPPRVATLAAGAVLLGASVAVFYPTLLALLVDRTPESERGSAIGTLSGSFDLGNVVGSALVGVTVERVSYAAGFGVAAAGALLGLLLFVLAERRATGRSVLPRAVPGV
ncbi:MAG TPA: MFS transporter [Methylomirabilota bacterium]|nr:MFS transporter [Methylomirabilota bacterium]